MKAPVVKYGWKVVAISYYPGHREKYTSSYVGNLRYMRRRWTHPEQGCGPLCVFSSYSSARSVSGIPEYIFRCKYVESGKHTVWTKNGRHVLVHDLHMGKVLASKVMLLYRRGERANGKRK